MATLTSKLIVSLTDMVSGPARGIGAALDRLQGKARAGTAVLGGGAFAGNAVRNLLAVGAGYVSVREGIGGTVGAAIKFEEAFADVRKVVDGTPAQLSAVRAEILAMSKDLPVTAEGMADIYAAAGQSGIALQELGKFSEMAAKVSVAWDVAQGETGASLAKIKTQLGLSVSELGLYADAINHLSNNTASAAPDLVDFAKRVAATGKMFGFQSTETLAFGAAMVSAGAESEVAATSFRNMGKALTKGAQATKSQREAFKRLGLDAVKTSKGMQKNALNTTLEVIERIQKLPEYERNSIASALFGDEARALMPIIADTRELRREIALVGTEASYAGSAFNEYLVRSETTANALQLIGNKFRAVGIGIGDGWLPTIKELGLGVGDVLDTLDKRVGVIDQIKTSMSGLMGGLGYGGTGGARELINDIGDLLFGKAFEGSLRDADERVSGLARLSNRFRGIGEDLRAFADNVIGGNIGDAVGNVGDALSKMSGGMTVAGALAVGLVGRGLIGIAAGAVALALSPIGKIAIVASGVADLINAAQGANSLGEFVDNLSKLSGLQLGGIALGLALVAGQVWSVVGGLRSLNVLKRGTPDLPKPAASAPAGTAAPKPTGTNFGAKPPANWRGPWGDGAAPGTTPKAGPSGPRGLGPQLPSPEAAGRSIGEGLKNIGAGWLKGLGAAAAAWTGEALINDAFRAVGINPDTSNIWRELEEKQRLGLSFSEFQSRRRGQEDNNSSFVDTMKWLWSQLPADLTKPIGSVNDGAPDDVSIVGMPPVAISGPVTTQPSGTQDVRVTNPMPAPIVHITVHAQTNADPGQIAGSIDQALSARLNALSRSAYSDGAN